MGRCLAAVVYVAFAVRANSKLSLPLPWWLSDFARRRFHSSLGGVAAGGGLLGVAWCGRCAERMCIWLPVLVCRVAAMLAAAVAGVSMCVMSGALKAMPVPLHSVSSLCAKTVHLRSL